MASPQSEAAKPHNCRYCSQSFSLVSNRNRHELRTCLSAPQHVVALRGVTCSACTRRFANAENLKRHLSKCTGPSVAPGTTSAAEGLAPALLPPAPVAAVAMPGSYVPSNLRRYRNDPDGRYVTVDDVTQIFTAVLSYMRSPLTFSQAPSARRACRSAKAERDTRKHAHSALPGFCFTVIAVLDITFLLNVGLEFNLFERTQLGPQLFCSRDLCQSLVIHLSQDLSVHGGARMYGLCRAMKLCAECANARASGGTWSTHGAFSCKVTPPAGCGVGGSGVTAHSEPFLAAACQQYNRQRKVEAKLGRELRQTPGAFHAPTWDIATNSWTLLF